MSLSPAIWRTSTSARGEQFDFQILKSGSRSGSPVRKVGVWMKPAVFGKSNYFDSARQRINLAHLTSH
jgi:hypothetical protein